LLGELVGLEIRWRRVYTYLDYQHCGVTALVCKERQPLGIREWGISTQIEEAQLRERANEK
jgi:hypothetical protein